MNSQKLTDITRGLQHAAQTTLSMVAEQFITLLDQFFYAEDDGTLKAKTVRVEVGEKTETTVRDDGKKEKKTIKTYVMIPLVSLVKPRGLALDNMHVKMSFRLEKAEPRPGTMMYKSDIERTSFTVAMAPRTPQGEQRKGDVFDVDMEFKAWEPPEAIMRVIDMYTNEISPFTLTLAEGQKPPVMPYVKTERFEDFLQRSKERMKPKEPQAKQGGG